MVCVVVASIGATRTASPTLDSRRRTDPTASSVLYVEWLMAEDIGVGDDGFAAIESADRGHFLLRELEVEDVEVLCDPARVPRPRDGDQTELDVPAEHDLGRPTSRTFADPVITGSFRSSSPDAPSGLHDSVTMPCAAW